MNPITFRNLVGDWRIELGRLHPREGCPSRARRRIEFVLALEFGKSRGRLHGHILIWRARKIPIEQLRELWRRMVRGRLKKSEPLLERYNPDAYGIGYALKTFQTQADLVSFSPRFARVVIGLE
jgi:hypothetical protein